MTRDTDTHERRMLLVDINLNLNHMIYCHLFCINVYLFGESHAAQSMVMIALLFFNLYSI